MRHKCLPDSPAGEDVRRACEEGPTSAYADPFGSMPVTSTVTGITYQNYKCAVCNNDSATIRFWTPRVECQLPKYSKTSMKFENRSMLADELVYNSRQKKWGVFFPQSPSALGLRGNSQVFYECSIDADMPPPSPRHGNFSVTLRYGRFCNFLYSLTLFDHFRPVKRNSEYFAEKWSEQKVLIIKVAGVYSTYQKYKRIGTACYNEGRHICQSVTTEPLPRLNCVKTEAYEPCSKIFYRAIFE